MLISDRVPVSQSLPVKLNFNEWLRQQSVYERALLIILHLIILLYFFQLVWKRRTTRSVLCSNCSHSYMYSIILFYTMINSEPSLNLVFFCLTKDVKHCCDATISIFLASAVNIGLGLRPRPVLLLRPIKHNIGVLTIHYLYSTSFGWASLRRCAVWYIF